MKYLGLDVHVKATVFCLLDEQGERLETGKVATAVPELERLIRRLGAGEELVVAQEVGKMAYLVHDVVSATGTRILSFNAWQLRMIASSRKKTDKRDAYWLAKALATGMTPTPVYMPGGEIRELRALLARRRAIAQERTRWLVRARSHLQAWGRAPTRGHRTVQRLLDAALKESEGADEILAQSLELCERMHSVLTEELKQVDALLHERAKSSPEVERLMTIPAVGERVALMIHAWVGEVSRFTSARQLASYAGLVPSVRQSGASHTLGGITRMGSPELRSMLVQAGHVLLFRCASETSLPLKALALRVHRGRARRKIAVVAAARYILRTAYYVLRDKTDYDPARLSPASSAPPLAAA
jgi:transposase